MRFLRRRYRPSLRKMIYMIKWPTADLVLNFRHLISGEGELIFVPSSNTFLCLHLQQDQFGIIFLFCMSLLIFEKVNLHSFITLVLSTKYY